ncbi:MoaD/ThiS family protein [Catenovulum maritimum]|uniref:Molybdopterin synthase sulfur carrier subunit n=1 Tax=Catenovulum maritimum TaxID=1513271 RepID=A0A0J8GTR7_9ALTE|nr:MoaD/ThiS family protein [Catenovulum maritimum]KMT66132.1 hypothetical protein XM47_04985 [Catenovulum maritimum]
MIKVLFFAKLKEDLNSAGVELEFDSISVQALKQKLVELNPSWAKSLSQSNVLSAVNQTMVGSEFIVKAGDEVAFFPPVTGG